MCHSYDKFWSENRPALHAYNYGANIEIKVSDTLAALPKGTHQRPEDNSAFEALRHSQEGKKTRRSSTNPRAVDSATPSQGEKPAWCILANRKVVEREYNQPQDVTFYPLAFHPTYGKFASASPPAFLDDLLTILRDNLRFENDSADVSYTGYF
jgi:hypothetical protein